jgi:hypothetical protein
LIAASLTGPLNHHWGKKYSEITLRILREKGLNPKNIKKGPTIVLTDILNKNAPPLTWYNMTIAQRFIAQNFRGKGLYLNDN